MKYRLNKSRILNKFKKFVRVTESKLPLVFLLILINLELRVRKIDEKISFNSNLNLFSISLSNGKQFYFSRKSRMILYAKGLESRVDSLSKKYSLTNPGLTLHSTHFVDCGANVGEVSWWIQSNTNLSIVAIEPEYNEFACLNLNLSPSNTIFIRGVLNEFSGTAELFHSPDSADTSLIPGKENLEYSEVVSWKLDDLISFYNLSKKSIALKVEAEGAEPEVLSGSQNSLSTNINFVTVDMSPERGIHQDSTSELVINTLETHGFEMVEHTQNYSALFLRTKSFEKIEIQ